jgi:hypothetical protein
VVVFFLNRFLCGVVGVGGGAIEGMVRVSGG